MYMDEGRDWANGFHEEASMMEGWYGGVPLRGKRGFKMGRSGGSKKGVASWGIVGWGMRASGENIWNGVG